LVTCLIGSFITERAGRKLAIEEQSKKEVDTMLPLRILMPYANPNSVDKLLDLAVALKEADSEQPIFPLSVVMEGDAHATTIADSNKAIENLAKLAYPNETRITPASRLDTNVANGIVRAVKEMMITVLILGWTGKSRTSEFFFGRKTDNILEATNQTVMIAKLNHLINLTDKIYIYVPENAEFEVGFRRWLYLVDQICKNAAASAVFYGNDESLKRIAAYAKKYKIIEDSSFNPLGTVDAFYAVAKQIGEDDLLLIVSSRVKGISYSTELEVLVDTITEEFEKLNFVLLYPEISTTIETDEILNVDVLESSFITENINLYQKAKKLIKGKLQPPR
jgi:nucleotide-binding universal stress UspA family protein